MKFSGRTTSLSHKVNNWKGKKANGKPCVRDIKLIDIQWSTCPVEIEDIVREMWQSRELGNDHYHLKFQGWEHLRDISTSDEHFKIFKEYLESQGVKEDDECFIYWWW